MNGFGFPRISGYEPPAVSSPFHRSEESMQRSRTRKKWDALGPAIPVATHIHPSSRTLALPDVHKLRVVIGFLSFLFLLEALYDF